MRIRIANEKVNFKDLKEGDVFKYQSEIYMKTKVLNVEASLSYNCVNLSRNEICYFHPTEYGDNVRVIKENAELVLGGSKVCEK